jgi:hypothetical protein
MTFVAIGLGGATGTEGGITTGGIITGVGGVVGVSIGKKSDKSSPSAVHPLGIGKAKRSIRKKMCQIEKRIKSSVVLKVNTRISTVTAGFEPKK